jgi:hypothetical protein
LTCHRRFLAGGVAFSDEPGLQIIVEEILSALQIKWFGDGFARATHLEGDLKDYGIVESTLTSVIVIEADPSAQAVLLDLAMDETAS